MSTTTYPQRRYRARSHGAGNPEGTRLPDARLPASAPRCARGIHPAPDPGEGCGSCFVEKMRMRQFNSETAPARELWGN